MFVIGTAGHIDHGKSTLVKALTGIDPDRLREEKEREMTIDLGFAWLKLPGGREVGVIDVPGHERFVKNMLAGVGGIDLALLVVAANEGAMPQTKEHLAIIDLLDIKKGIIVLTMKDLVDEEWLNLVKMDLQELIAPTTLAKAPMVAVSSITGEGLPELLATIDTLLSSAEARKDLGRPRLPADRVFTITGAGTVVTGTLIDGSLTVGQEVEVVPPGLKSRLRGLQTHKARVETATPGSRVAANLVGLSTADLKRGDVVTVPGWLTPTTLVTVKLRSLAYLRRPIRHSSILSFFTGAAEVIAKLRLLEGDKLPAGATTWAQLILESPVALVEGDHFILRSTEETLGGGQIIEAHTRPLRRFRPEVIVALKAMEGGTAEEAILAFLEARQPQILSALVSQSKMSAEPAKAMLESLVRQGKIVRVGQGEQALLMTTAGWKTLVRKATGILQEYHGKFPARPGMPKEELGSRLKLGAQSAVVLQKLLEQGAIEGGATVRLPGHSVKFTPAQQAKMDAFLRSISQNPYAPPGDLIPEPDLLNWLIEQRKVVKVSEGIVFSAAAFDEMVQKTVALIKERGKATLGEVRDLFGTSRKYAQAFLEYTDAHKITRRVGDDRVIY